MSMIIGVINVDYAYAVLSSSLLVLFLLLQHHGIISVGSPAGGFVLCAV